MQILGNSLLINSIIVIVNVSIVCICEQVGQEREIGAVGRGGLQPCSTRPT